VATAVLAASDIAVPIRQLTRKQRNLAVMWAELKAVDLKARSIEVDCQSGCLKEISFDYLVLATGVQPSYLAMTSLPNTRQPSRPSRMPSGFVHGCSRLTKSRK